MEEGFLGVVTSPAEHPHLLCHAGLDAEAGHYRACEPEPRGLSSQAPAFDAGVRDFLILSLIWELFPFAPLSIHTRDETVFVFVTHVNGERKEPCF